MQVLVTHRPEDTTALLMRLCTLGDPAAADGEWLAKVADFAHLYSDRHAAIASLVLCCVHARLKRDIGSSVFENACKSCGCAASLYGTFGQQNESIKRAHCCAL